ncbi:MAG: hypothetical protein Q8R60_15075 [Mycobacteriales bacterium]|nr:hypothetical protein [Mycobacteriales bacterium]
MFERVRDMPRAIVAHKADDPLAYERAAQWTLAHSQRLGGHPLLYAPGKRNFQDEPVLVSMSKRVTVATWKTLSNARWGGGPVLAAWPTQKHLADIDGDRRTSALCVLSWAPTDTAAWASAHQPERLSPGAPADPPPTIADPVVVEGMKTLTVLVNHANNLAGAMDRRDAVNVLLTLHDAGHQAEPDELYAWALANGWPAGGATRLKEFAVQIAGGHRPRVDRGALRPDILEVWRREATGA